MSKVSDAVINALKAKFETGDIPDGPDFSEFLDAVQEAAQDHEHNAEGGSGSGTGDASKVAWSTGLSGIPGAFPPSEHNHDDRYFTEDEHIATSTGAPDAGKPIKLDAAGKVDPTMVDGGGAFPGCEENDMSDVALVRDLGEVTTTYTTILNIAEACILISGLIEGQEGPGFLDKVRFTIDGTATEISYGSGDSPMVNHLPMINADASLKIEFKTTSGIGVPCVWQLWTK